MIRVERSQTRSRRRIEPPSTWFDKARDQTADAIRDGSGHEVDAGVYAHDDLRAALEELFHHKCAYCEINISSGFNWDVEHFRPKGRVIERSEHPGYYWLAYEWTNLYPSCQHCNQARKDRKLFDDPTEGPTRGKKDQFPLADETTRAMDPDDDITSEKRLLLDPCGDQPEDHVAFGADGGAIAIADDSQAKASIHVYHLNRRRLKKDRRLRIQQTVEVLRVVDELRAAGHHAPAGRLLDTVRDQFATDASPLAGVVRSILHDPAAFGLLS